MLRAANAGGRIGELAGCGLCRRYQVLDVVGRKIGMRKDAEACRRDLTNRIEGFERVIGKRLRHHAGDDMAIVHHVERVAVSGRMGDGVGRKGSRRTWSVLDDEGLTELFLE